MVKNESLRKLSPLQLIALTLCTLIALVAPRVALAVEHTQYDTAAAGYKAIFDEWQDWCSVDGIAEGKNWKYVVQRVEFIPSEVKIDDLGYAFVADNVFGPKTMVVGDTTTSKIYAIYQYLPENKGIAATLTIAKSRLSDEYVAQEKGVYAYTTHSTSSVSTYYVKPSSYAEDVMAYRSLQYTSTDQTKDATLTWKTFKDNKTFDTTGLDDYNIAMLRV